MGVYSLLRSVDSATQEYRVDIPPKFRTSWRPDRCVKSELASTFYRCLTARGPNGEINRIQSRMISRSLLDMPIRNAGRFTDTSCTRGGAPRVRTKTHIHSLQIPTQIMRNKDNDFARLEDIGHMFARSLLSAELNANLAK